MTAAKPAPKSSTLLPGKEIAVPHWTDRSLRYTSNVEADGTLAATSVHLLRKSVTTGCLILPLGRAAELERVTFGTLRRKNGSAVERSDGTH